ncbi:splicing factor 1 [Drosophila nasuta]|uniref:splicing factor 1 n=1 Tax=Drosophila nasuta TaxID=42062 RepID=UPI00295F135A|nr:splicing factor 1 [Drosophila nasuta]
MWQLRQRRLPNFITGLIKRHLIVTGAASSQPSGCSVQIETLMRIVAKMSSLMLLLLMLLSAICCADLQQDEQEELQPEHYDGRSFFFLGTLFRRWRDRWLAFHNPAPLYAGAAFPINGYYNCPPFGCNPAGIGPQPGYYPPYYGSSLQQQQQQQQQAQGNSNVYIYQTDQNSASSATGSMPPYGSAFLGPARQPTPLLPPSSSSPQAPPFPPLPPLPPRPIPLPPATLPPQVSASSSGGGSSFGFGAVPLPVPLPVAGCCALG